MPHCADMKTMGEESMQKKFAAGPVAMISVTPNGMPPMGKLLTQQILFFYRWVMHDRLFSQYFGWRER